MKPVANHPDFLSSYGRNRGRSLRPYQQRLVDELLPSLLIGTGELEKWRNGELLFPQLPNSPIPQFLSLEIGFGAGEHLLSQALHHPDRLYIGCEPFINGVAKLLAGVDMHKLRNIRLFTEDARLLIQQLPDACLDEVFILFPDPWPKLRHNKRRLVNAQTLSMLARVHKPGGRLLIATDHEDYCAWILEHVLASPDYRWTAREKADWQNHPSDWTQTKYQRKTSAEGRPPVFMECRRN